MKPLLSLLLLSLTLLSCHSGKAPDVQLTSSALYNIDSVRMAAVSGDEKAARKQFLAGVDLYKNKKDFGGSIEIFKKSILIKPTAQAYYELGGALLDLGRPSEAVDALHIAEKLEYQPMANVMFRLCAAYSSIKTNGDEETKRDSAVLACMQTAIQMGYGHPEEFLSNPLFADTKSLLYRYTKVYKEALSGGNNSKDPEQMLWEEFKNEFTASITLPLTINNAWINDHTLEKTIDFDYEKFVPEMRTAAFSREVDKEYYYFAQIRSDSAYTALLYAGKHVSLETENLRAPVFYFLVTYNKAGKIIDKLEVAGQQEFTDPVKVFTLQPNYTFEVRDFKNIYKEDPEKVGYDSNTIIRTDPAGLTNYRIAANGKFEKTDAPLAMR